MAATPAATNSAPRTRRVEDCFMVSVGPRVYYITVVQYRDGGENKEKKGIGGGGRRE